MKEKKVNRMMLSFNNQISQLIFVQLMETGHPGQFKLWALIGNDLHAMKVNVPRIFYVNQRTPKEGEGASKYLYR